MESNSEKVTTTSKESFLMIIDLLNELNIQYWIEGGWGIDALIGRQTRLHRDIDLDLDTAVEELLPEKLMGRVISLH